MRQPLHGKCVLYYSCLPRNCFFFLPSVFLYSEESYLQTLTPLITSEWINVRAFAVVNISAVILEGTLFCQRRPGCPGSCVMDGGIIGPSDKRIIAAALPQWDLSPSRLPVNYVSSCLVCSCSGLGSSAPLALMWLAPPSPICTLIS